MRGVCVLGGRGPGRRAFLTDVRFSCFGGSWVLVPPGPRRPALGQGPPVAHLSWFVPPEPCPELPLLAGL